MEFDLSAGQVIQVDTGCIVAFDETVDYDIQLAGGIKTALFGGEGFFLATLTGPGHVVIQSMTLNKLRRELATGPQRRRRAQLRWERSAVSSLRRIDLASRYTFTALIHA